MADENPTDFRFNNDEPEPEAFYHEELRDLRVEKLSQRVMLLSILLPCLIAVAIYFGYQNLSDRISRSRGSGSLEIQQLSKKLDELSKTFNEKLITFSTTLSTQDKDFGTSIEGRLLAINKNINRLGEEIKSLNDDLSQELTKNQDLIDKLHASKADKKSQAVAVEKIYASIKPMKTELEKLKTIKKDLNTVSEDIKKLGSKLNKNLAAATARAEKIRLENQQLKASLTELAGKAIDGDALALESFKLKKNIQNQLSKVAASLDQRMDSIQSEVNRLETTVQSQKPSQKQSMKKVSQKGPPQPSGTPWKNGSGSVSSSTGSPTITEKDLLE